MRTKLMREVKAALAEHCVKPWSIRQGTKHHLLLIEGRLVATFSLNPQDRKDAKNIIAAIRKHGR